MHVVVIVECVEKICNVFAGRFAQLGKVFGEVTDFGGNHSPAGGF